MELRTNSEFALCNVHRLVLYNQDGEFTAQYALSSFMKQTRLAFEGLEGQIMKCGPSAQLVSRGKADLLPVTLPACLYSFRPPFYPQKFSLELCFPS
jgi:hypothetical protein